MTNNLSHNKRVLSPGKPFNPLREVVQHNKGSRARLPGLKPKTVNSQLSDIQQIS